MSSPLQITVSYLVYSAANPAVVTTASVSIPTPTILQNLDVNQNASTQTGFNAMDSLLVAIAKKKGVTFTDATGVVNFIPLGQIVSIKGA